MYIILTIGCFDTVNNSHILKGTKIQLYIYIYQIGIAGHYMLDIISRVWIPCVIFLFIRLFH